MRTSITKCLLSVENGALYLRENGPALELWYVGVMAHDDKKLASVACACSYEKKLKKLRGKISRYESLLRLGWRPA